MLSAALPQVHPRASDTLWDLWTPGRIKLVLSLCQGLFFLAVTTPRGVSCSPEDVFTTTNHSPAPKGPRMNPKPPQKSPWGSLTQLLGRQLLPGHCQGGCQAPVTQGLRPG